MTPKNTRPISFLYFKFILLFKQLDYYVTREKQTNINYKLYKFVSKRLKTHRIDGSSPFFYLCINHSFTCTNYMYVYTWSIHVSTCMYLNNYIRI